MSFYDIAAIGAIVTVIGLTLVIHRYLMNYRYNKRVGIDPEPPVHLDMRE